MRNDTRVALEQLLEFLSDNSLAASVGVGLYDALNARPGAKSVAAAGQAVTEIMNNTETAGANAQSNLEVGSEADAEFPIEFIKEALRDPLAQVSQQFLAPQGIHNTYVQLKTLMESVTESPLSEAIDLRLAGVEQDEIIQQVSAGDEDSDLEPEDANAETESKIENLTLESMKGGFIVTGHSKTMGESNPLRGTYPETIQLPENESNPQKSKPAYTYCAFFDPMQPFARKEAALAAASATLIPTLEWSRAIPYFNLQVLGPATKVPINPDNEEEGYNLRSTLSIDEFFAGTVGGISAGSRFTDLPGEGPNSDRLVGMEAFTLPQSIIPTGKTPDLNPRSYQSVDSTRPFMTIKDFSVSVTPTRGTSSSMRATLNIILHDRGRMPQLANLLKPATLNRYGFDIEWGWSHPAGDPTSGNVYGQFINSLRTRQIFSLYQTSYSFTADGQVDIKCDLVTKGTNALNELDIGTTTVVPADRGVQLAIEAVNQAAKSVGVEDTVGIADTSPINNLTTLGPDSLGSLIDGEVVTKLAEIVESSGKPNLYTLSVLLDDLVAAVDKASSVAQDNIENKIKRLTSISYDKYEVYTKGIADSPAGVGKVNLIGDSVADGAWKGNGASNYVPLGAILEAFVVQPLFQTHQYDEIQLVTYTANLNAGAAAGANLGALPIDIKNTGGPSLQEMLKEQVTEYGGQYPVSRFLRFVSQNFVEMQAAPMYGVVEGGLTGMKVDENSGNLVPKKENKNLAKSVKQKLLPIYYNEKTPSSAAEPRPTPFTPIKLKVIFDAAPSVPLDSLDDPQPPDPSDPLLAPRQVLRIHVVDAAGGTSASQGWMQILKQARSAAAPGVVVPPVPRQPPTGMSEAARLYSNLENNLLSCAQVCQWLSDVGILKPTAPSDSEAGENNKKIAELELTIQDRESALTNPDVNVEDRETLQRELDEASAALTAARENRPMSQPYQATTDGTKVIDLVSQTAPNLVWGREGSVATSITVKQKASDGAGTTYMMRALRGGEAGKSSPSRGLPMRIHSADVGVEMFGNPLVKYMQQFFVNTNSGTTIDNLYAVIGIEHKVTKEDYRTSLSLAPQEAYGIFESLTDQADKAQAAVERLKSIQAERVYQADLASAQAAQSDAQELYSKSGLELGRYISATNTIVSEIWKYCLEIIVTSIDKGITQARRNHKVTQIGRNDALQAWDEWVAGNTAEKVWWYGLWAKMGAKDKSKLTNILYEICKAYERNIQGLWTGNLTKNGMHLRITVAEKCGQIYAGHFGSSYDETGIVVRNILNYFLAVGAIPYWSTGNGLYGYPASMRPSGQWGITQCRVNMSTHDLAHRSGNNHHDEKLTFFMTDRFGNPKNNVPTSFAAAYARGGWNLASFPGWYESQAVEFTNPGVGWFGINSARFPSPGPFWQGQLNAHYQQMSYPFVGTFGQSLNTRHLVPANPPIGTVAEVMARRAKLADDLVAANAVLESVKKTGRR